MKATFPPLVSLAIFAYCAWISRGLLVDWAQDPLAHLSWLVLVIWFSPVVLSRIPKFPFTISLHYSNPILLALALVVSLLGVVGEVNILKYSAFVLATAAFLPWSWQLGLWMLCAASWMPVLALLGAYTNLQYILPIRFVLAAGGAILVLQGLRSYHKMGSYE